MAEKHTKIIVASSQWLGILGIINKNNNISLRRRLKVFASLLVLLIFVSAGYGYQRLSITQSTIKVNLVERNNVLEATHILRAGLLDTYQAINSFLLEPSQVEFSESINETLGLSISLSKNLADGALPLHEGNKEDFYKLYVTLRIIADDIDELIEIRLDPNRQYPSLAIGSDIMQPNRNNVNNAFGVAINALNGEEKLIENPEVLEVFINGRHLWTQVLSNFRLYLANRMGSFNEKALSAQEKGIETLYGEYRNNIKRLQVLVDDGVIGFETSEAYDVLLESSAGWFSGFQKVKHIHGTDAWRIDAKQMKEKITPNIERASNILRIVSTGLADEAGDDVTELGKVASQQTLILWLVAGIAMTFVIFIFVSVEKAILTPISIIASALKQEALGKTAQELPTMYSSETKDLVDAFSEMSRQIHLRQSELEYRALHDSLTSLPNRTLLFDHIEHDIFIARRENTQLSLLMIDLDLFKEVNDTFGHAIGDQLLIEVGKRFKEVLRDIDTVARMGGDEFSILLPGVGQDEVISIAKKMLKVSQLPYEINELKLVVSASIGAAIFPMHGEDAKNLLQHADVAMYVAKQNKLGYSIYDPAQDQYSIKRYSMIADLQEAIENDTLELYYQPKLELRSKNLLGVEALLRWTHPEHGFVPPEEIVELAEQTGFISKLTYWVAEKAIIQLMLWREKNINFDVSINISAHDLKEESFVSGIKAILEKHQFPHESLTLEVTENAMMSNPMLAINTLTEFSNMGLSISVDDYGTGFSSLSYLSKLPVNELKIDKSFVMNMDTDSSNETIVRSTIELAHNLGLKVVAEGIETELVWNMLRSYGCDEAQGYFMSKPIPAQEFEDWLENKQQAVG